MREILWDRQGVGGLNGVFGGRGEGWIGRDWGMCRVLHGTIWDEIDFLVVISNGYNQLWGDIHIGCYMVK